MDTPTAVPQQPSSGDHTRWFTEEVHAHDRQLKAFLEGRFPAIRSDVDDIVQESYLRILKRQASRPIESVKGFLFTAARRLAIDLLRKNKRSPIDLLGSLAVLDVIDERASVCDPFSVDEKFDLLVEAISHLPDRCYQVVQLHKFQGFSQKEVAQKLGLSERTVANHTFRALRLCENYLRARGITRL